MSKRQRKAQAAAEAAYIRAEGDEPLDLLSRSIAGGVSRADPSASRKRKPGQDASHFKTDKRGRLIIEDGDSDGGDDAMGADAAAGAGNAYLTAMTGIDGAVRDGRGGIKFNKNTKRSREEERAQEAMDLDELIGDKPKKKAKKAVKRLGEEYKSKVSVRMCGVTPGLPLIAHHSLPNYNAHTAARRRRRQEGQRPRPVLVRPHWTGGPAAWWQGRARQPHQQEEGLARMSLRDVEDGSVGAALQYGMWMVFISIGYRSCT